MRHSILASLAVAVVANLPTIAAAQTAADPSGHWEGALVIPNGELAFVIDLGRPDNGALIGTISIPSQQLNGLPLTSVKFEGRTVTFTIAANNGGTFTGELTDKTIAGDFSGAQGSTTFQLTRTGDATFALPLRGPALAPGMEGTWMGTLRADGRSMRIKLTMANRADGTSIGHAISLDEGNLDLPIAITDGSASAFAFNVPAIGSTYLGTLNASHSEISGTYGQGPVRLPLTFVRTQDK